MSKPIIGQNAQGHVTVTWTSQDAAGKSFEYTTTFVPLLQGDTYEVHYSTSASLPYCSKRGIFESCEHCYHSPCKFEVWGERAVGEYLRLARM
jgi:hypothetical protein